MADNQDPRIRALAKLQEMEFVPENPLVRTVARRLGFKPETLAKRVHAAFATEFAQCVYTVFMYTAKRAAYPETIAACFSYFNDGREIRPTDFGEKGKVNRILDNTSETLVLMSRGYMNKDAAMRFVERFGDQAEDVYNLIGENLQLLMRRLRVRAPSPQAMMGILHAIAYADEEHPEMLDMDVVTVDDVERMLGCFPDTEMEDDE